MDRNYQQAHILIEPISLPATPETTETESCQRGLLNPEVDEGKLFRHTLEDGREVAGTFEQARKVCPVIGRMSVENAQATLEQADLAERVAARGRTRREAKEQSEKPTTTHKTQKDPTEDEVKPADTTKMPIPETEKPPVNNMNAISGFISEPDKLVSPLQPKTHRKHDEINPVATNETLEELFDKFEIEESTAPPPTRVDTRREHRYQVRSITEKHPSKAVNNTSPEMHPVQPLALLNTEHQLIAHIPTRTGLPDIATDNGVEPPYIIEAEHAYPTDVTDRPVSSTYLEPASNETIDATAATTIHEAGAERGSLVAETYRQLVTILESSVDTASPDDITVSQNKDTIEINEFHVASGFHEYLASQPQPTEAADFYTIKLYANEQSIENSIIQLAYYLQVSRGEADESLMIVLEDFAEVLPQKLFVHSTEMNQHVLTPALTDSFLNLLGVIGYKNPEETLIRFASVKNLEFLIQAAYYLYQLTNEDNNQEFLPGTAVTPKNILNATTAYLNLGRAIASLSQLAIIKSLAASNA